MPSKKVDIDAKNVTFLLDYNEECFSSVIDTIRIVEYYYHAAKEFNEKLSKILTVDEATKLNKAESNKVQDLLKEHKEGINSTLKSINKSRQQITELKEKYPQFKTKRDTFEEPSP